ncbi:MAG: aldo/keto reductase [Cyclobacteriaceae bacterium]
MPYTAAPSRYQSMPYNRCGNSGILLPAISLGLWHNFGDVDNFEKGTKTLQKAFDLGVTHFDLANNYGPPYGSAETNFGKMLKRDFASYRDELLISSKAGYDMWDGPYGDWGSKKYLVSSLDQSLKRMQLDYVDIFYHHRLDPETPLEETMQALDLIVRQGKALYAGISNYPADKLIEAKKILDQLGTPYTIHQARYSMLDRALADEVLPAIEKEKIGCIVFSPLAQGMLTDKYLKGIPEGSRAASGSRHLDEKKVLATIEIVKQLNEVAAQRGQKLSQMAIAWLLHDKRINSVLLGASSPEQIEENVSSLNNLHFTDEEIQKIETILKA